MKIFATLSLTLAVSLITVTSASAQAKVVTGTLEQPYVVPGPTPQTLYANIPLAAVPIFPVNCPSKKGCIYSIEFSPLVSGLDPGALIVAGVDFDGSPANVGPANPISIMATGTDYGNESRSVQWVTGAVKYGVHTVQVVWWATAGAPISVGRMVTVLTVGQ